jgi:hypothetical protein
MRTLFGVVHGEGLDIDRPVASSSWASSNSSAQSVVVRKGLLHWRDRDGDRQTQTQTQTQRDTDSNTDSDTDRDIHMQLRAKKKKEVVEIKQ